MPPARRHRLILISTSPYHHPYIYARADVTLSPIRPADYVITHSSLHISMILFYAAPRPPACMHIQSRQPPAHANPRRPPASSNCGMHYPIPAAITIHPVSSEMTQTILINPVGQVPPTTGQSVHIQLARPVQS
jgi:hypothetical protein